MMMSREFSQFAGDLGTLAGDLGTLVPNVNCHRLFTFDGQALEAGGGPPALAARSGPSGCSTGAAGAEGTAIWLP